MQCLRWFPPVIINTHNKSYSFLLIIRMEVSSLIYTLLAPYLYVTVFRFLTIAKRLSWTLGETFIPLQSKQILWVQIFVPFSFRFFMFLSSILLHLNEVLQASILPWLIMWYALLIVSWMIPSFFNSAISETMIATTRLIITKLK